MSLRAILNDGDGPQHHEAEAAMSQSETAAAKGYPEVEDFTMDLSALMPHRPAPNSSSVSSHTAVIDLSQDNGDIACSSQTTNLPSQTTSRSISPSAQDVPSRSSSQAPRASSRPHSAASSQTCIPQKRKAQQSGPIDISDDEAASATASTYSSQAPVPSTSKTEDPDSDLEITHYAQSSPQRQRQPEVIHNNTPVLMGQITTVALIVNDLPELCPKALLNSNVPFPPLPVILHKDDPRFARPDSESADRVHVITLQGQRFGNLESRISGALGPVIDGAPCKAHHVRFQAAVQRQKPTGVRPNVYHSGWFNTDTLQQPCTAILPLHILVFSTPQFFRAMSDHLSSKSVFLDHPTVPYNGPERYNNPHNPSVRLAQDEAQARLQSLQHRMRPMYAGEGSAAPTGSRTAPGQQMSEDAKREQVEAVFATMNSGADLDAVEPNRAIVKSNLYHHQKQALAFLLDREALKSMPDPNAEPDNQYIGLWRLERSEPARWTNVVTGVWQPFSALRPVLPPQCRGAILADDMGSSSLVASMPKSSNRNAGLGKTIVIISLIAQTRSEALAFETDTAKLGQADASHQGFDAVKAHPVTKQRETSFHYLHNVGQQKKKDKGPGKREVAREEADERRRSRLSRRSRATLIICPLSTVQNWESQIAEHAEKGSTNVYIYHGSSRTSSVNNLSDHDVVITTFSTLGAEYSKMARAEDEEGEGSSDVGESEEVEVVNSFGGIGLPVQQNGDVKKSKPAKSKKPKPKAADGSAYTSPLQQIEWFRVVLDEAQ